MSFVPADSVTFQDSLFSTERVVQRVLPGGTVLRLTLEPLPGGRVRVLAYQRRRVGEHWQSVREEEGRTLAFERLGLSGSFADLFGADLLGVAGSTVPTNAPVRPRRRRR